MFSRQNKIKTLFVSLLILGMVFGVFQYAGVTKIYPVYQVKTGNGLSLVYYNRPVMNQSVCASILDAIDSSVGRSCHHCGQSIKRCETSLPDSQKIYFSDHPVAQPIAHLKTGVMVFFSQLSTEALSLCRETAAALAQQFPASGIQCFPQEETHPYFRSWGNVTDSKSGLQSLVSGFLALLVSFITVFLILRFEHTHAHLSHDQDIGPQKFHALPTPRIGGVALAVGLFSGVWLQVFQEDFFSQKDFALLLFAAIPAFTGGLVEDVTKSVTPLRRLLLTMGSGLLGALLLGGVISEVGIPPIDWLLGFYVVSVLFTIVAVGGVANAINIIDGYNGLASGSGAIISLAMAFVASQQGDAFLCYANLLMAGSLIGFWLWNWPKGSIFLGDGGAYLLGFWLAEMSILLVVRNPAVSVWFPLLLLIHPVMETLFSIYRRTFVHQSPPGLPDAMHLHQMIFKRLVRVGVGSKDPELRTLRNALVAPYFWGVNALIAWLAAIYYKNTLLLTLLLAAFVVFYVVIYRKLFSWHIPSWCRVRS